MILDTATYLEFKECLCKIENVSDNYKYMFEDAYLLPYYENMKKSMYGMLSAFRTEVIIRDYFNYDVGLYDKCIFQSEDYKEISIIFEQYTDSRYNRKYTLNISTYKSKIIHVDINYGLARLKFEGRYYQDYDYFPEMSHPEHNENISYIKLYWAEQECDIEIAESLNNELYKCINYDRIQEETYNKVSNIQKIIELISKSEGYSEENKKLILKESNDRIIYLKKLEEIEINTLMEE